MLPGELVGRRLESGVWCLRSPRALVSSSGGLDEEPSRWRWSLALLRRRLRKSPKSPSTARRYKGGVEGGGEKRGRLAGRSARLGRAVCMLRCRVHDEQTSRSSSSFKNQLEMKDKLNVGKHSVKGNGRFMQFHLSRHFACERRRGVFYQVLPCRFGSIVGLLRTFVPQRIN